MNRLLFVIFITSCFAAIVLIWVNFFPRLPTNTSPTIEDESPSALSQLLNRQEPSPVPSPTLPPPPTQKTLSGGVQVFQTFNNCGPAALSMALSHYGVNISQQELGRQLRPYQHPRGDNDDKSVTLEEVAAKARQYGFVVYHRPAGDIQIVKHFIAHDMPVLTRTWLHAGEDIGHFRLIKGYDDNTQEVVQDDSLQGANLRYSYQDFEELWRAFNNEFVVLVPPEKQAVAERILGELKDESTAWRKSVELADATLSQNPTDVYSAFNKSAALYHLGDYTASTQIYESVESRLPRRMLWYQLEPLMAYFKLGNAERVLQITSSILNDQNRAYSELYFLRSQVFRQQGNDAAADEALRLVNVYNSTDSWRVNVAD